MKPNEELNEIPKHKKKKYRTVKKSSHKHKYKECLIVDNDDMCYLGSYCIHCKKIGEIKLPSIKEGNYLKHMNKEELLKKYNYLEIKYVENIFKSKTIKEGN